MSHNARSLTKDEAPLNFLFENSVFLIAGAIAALVWANWDHKSHEALFHFDLTQMLVPKEDGHSSHKAVAPEDSHETKGAEKGGAEGEGHSEEKSHKQDPKHDSKSGDKGHDKAPVKDDHSADGHDHGSKDAAGHSKDDHGGGHGHDFNLYFIINDILMAVFFAIAAKEVWEAMLPGGALSDFKKASLPLLATAGGVLGPALLYVAGVMLFDGSDGMKLFKGWAIPCATDIAFSYLVARLIFGAGHPAIAFLLLLAIADDAVGLVIIAVFYPDPSKPMELQWLLLSLAAMILTFTMSKCRIHSFWWYLLIPGAMCWYAFFRAGVHPALGLVPIIPLMPHAHTDLGMFVKEELDRNDTLNEFEHWWKQPVEIFLGLFGLCNAAVPFDGMGLGTWLVLVGLLAGKPIGISICTFVGDKFLGLRLPKGMDHKQVLVVGFIAAIGFTVALFVSTAAFDNGTAELLAVKMGALYSFGAAVIAFVVAKVMGVGPLKSAK